jgi:CelD/BcsL family acetyltransferase involved in cellulose biosynthesis
MDQIKEEWNQLFQHGYKPHIFQSWEWNRAALQNSPQNTPYILLISEKGRLRAISPFCLQDDAVIFAGSNWAGYNSLIIEKEEDLKSIWPLVLEYILVERKTVERLCLDDIHESHLPPGHEDLLEPNGEGPFTPLPDTWEKYSSTLSKGFDHNLRHYAGLLEKHFPDVAYKLVSDEAEVKRTLEEMNRFKLEVWKAKGLPEIDIPEARMAIQEEAALFFLKRGWLRAYELSVDSRTIAVELMFYFQGVLTDFNGGYDIQFKKYSPSNLLIAHCLKMGIKEGATEFDMLIVAAKYKFNWCSKTKKVYRFYVEAE